ncbi:MAG: nuclear transport factor 2 family protein [Betaproteobacteria bacterium]
MPHEFATPEAAETAFYEAFEAADLEAMMAVWVDQPDIVCIHPGGTRLLGAAQIRESWRQIFESGERLAFRIAERQAVQDTTLAVHNVYEQVSIPGQAEEPAAVLVTNVYLLTDVGWRLWMHHACAPGDADEDDEDQPPTLH